MSNFEVRPYQLSIEPHPDPEVERLEIARVGDYTCVVGKGQYHDGEEALYIPEGALVPIGLLEIMGLTKKQDGKVVGMLSGKDGNRVKAIRLRGVISQGLVYQPDNPLDDIHDYAPELGIEKYMPPIPLEMAGDVEHVPGLRGYTDIENIKAFPGIFKDGDIVHISEKLHGSLVEMTLIDGVFYVSSKGLASKQLALKENERNVYWRAAREHEIENVLDSLVDEGFVDKDIAIFGEVLGVQDLMYELRKGQISLRIFDIRIDGKYLDISDQVKICEEFGLPRVPDLANSWVFDRNKLDSFVKGKSTIASHIREGIVIRPIAEEYNNALGRVILKSINEEYLFRKGKTTEYE